ncbi:ligase-associated DNA damage response endonuclease PdeM [Xanthobacter sp. TB0139]|uniref:ligase-associated DNA damage response endonuclease PdeM n=1 Tax=Xanthobacter sp. TB0139 TaxID=3459178 RepID=UPI00403A278D
MPESNTTAALTLLDLNGAELLLDPSGAVFWVEERALLVADMHLEKGSSFARRGQMLPPYDTQETLNRLALQIRRHQPRTVIALGDSLHDRWAEERLPQQARDSLLALQQGLNFIWIAGNHDPLPHGFGGEGLAELKHGPLTFRHEPTGSMPTGSPPTGGEPAGELCGHLHPVARVATRGRSVRRRCFVTDGMRMVLPAFGAFTGGLDVSDPAIAGLFPLRPHELHLLGAGRTYRLPGPPLRSG